MIRQLRLRDYTNKMLSIDLTGEGRRGTARSRGEWIRSPGLYLLDAVQQRGQPVLVDLTVAVQEGEDPGPGGVSPPHPGPDQT